MEFYDQTTYFGRVKYFMDLTHPRNLLYSDDDLRGFRDVYAKYKSADSGISVEDARRAKIALESTLHPDTGEKILLPFRMAAFVPTNLVVVAGLLLPNPTTLSVVFWQWANQSVNVAFNWANANKSTKMSTNETAVAYAQAVIASCSVGAAMNYFARSATRLPPLARSVIAGLGPFTAVAVAGTLNVYLMRANELRHGITVRDERGEAVGTSKIAANSAVFQVAVSRVLNAFPILTVPPAILHLLQKTELFKRQPRLSAIANFGPTFRILGLIGAALMVTLPFSIGVFPQKTQVLAGELEPSIAQKVGEGTTVWFNKGL